MTQALYAHMNNKTIKKRKQYWQEIGAISQESLSHFPIVEISYVLKQIYSPV
jgi:hypothetical protein